MVFFYSRGGWRGDPRVCCLRLLSEAIDDRRANRAPCCLNRSAAAAEGAFFGREVHISTRAGAGAEGTLTVLGLPDRTVWRPPSILAQIGGKASELSNCLPSQAPWIVDL